MRHNCKDRLCDTPHEEETYQERQSRLEYETKKYLEWDALMRKILCPHGFKRSVMPDFDCSECRSKEKPNVIV